MWGLTAAFEADVPARLRGAGVSSCFMLIFSRSMVAWGRDDASPRATLSASWASLKVFPRINASRDGLPDNFLQFEDLVIHHGEAVAIRLNELANGVHGIIIFKTTIFAHKPTSSLCSDA